MEIRKQNLCHKSCCASRNIVQIKYMYFALEKSSTNKKIKKNKGKEREGKVKVLMLIKRTIKILDKFINNQSLGEVIWTGIFLFFLF